eukprot:746273-Hanusia_phi.AAC.6
MISQETLTSLPPLSAISCGIEHVLFDLESLLSSSRLNTLTTDECSDIHDPEGSRSALQANRKSFC